MTHKTLALVAASMIGGCVIYDERRCPACSSDGVSTDTGAEQPTPDPVFWLDPNVVEEGATEILSLQSDQAVDFAAIAELDFLGDVSVCTTSAREDELLLTVAAGSELGPVDLVIVFEDQASFFVDDAITVVATGEVPDDGTDTGGGTDDGGGSAGSDGGGTDTGGSDDGGSGGSDGGSDDGGSSGGGC